MSSNVTAALIVAACWLVLVVLLVLVVRFAIAPPDDPYVLPVGGGKP